MKIELNQTFLSDIRKLRNPKLKNKIADFLEFLKKIDNISEISHFRKLSGHDTAYRIRLGDYRLGVYLIGDTIVLSRFLHRKDIYNFFPLL